MRLITWTRQIPEILRHHDVQQLRVSKTSMARDILEKLARIRHQFTGVGKLDRIVKPLVPTAKLALSPSFPSHPDAAAKLDTAL